MKNKVLYPNFHSIFKCTSDFKVFKTSKKYRITGFGKTLNKISKEKVDTWWVKSLYDNGKEFPVLKSTVNSLFDNKILIDANE